MNVLRGLIVALLALTGAVHAAQDLDTAALAAALDKARGEQVDALAPTNFAAAVQAHEAAVKDASRGRNADKVRARVQEGEAALRRATTAAAAARQLLGSVIKAREDALTAEAPKFATRSVAEGSRALPRRDGRERAERHQECAATRGRSGSPAARSGADRDQGRHSRRSARADRAGRRSEGRQARAAQPAGGEALSRRGGAGNPAQSLRRERSRASSPPRLATRRGTRLISRSSSSAC